MVDDLRPVYEALAAAYRDGKPAALATIIETQGSIPRHTGSKMLIYADASTVGTIGGGAMESLVIKEALASLSDGQTRTKTYSLNNLEDGDPGICGGSATIFIEPLQLPATVVVIGGGHVGKALAELAKWAGFRVVLSDDRPEFCSESYVPGLDQYLVCKPGELTQHLSLNRQTYIAAVTRGLPVDVLLFPALLATDALYIGLIGSRRRWALTRKVLKEEHGIDDEQLARVHSPIGLELQAETPKEIAISILAEMIMIQRGGTGESMKWAEQE